MAKVFIRIKPFFHFRYVVIKQESRQFGMSFHAAQGFWWPKRYRIQRFQYVQFPWQNQSKFWSKNLPLKANKKTNIRSAADEILWQLHWNISSDDIFAVTTPLSTTQKTVCGSSAFVAFVGCAMEKFLPTRHFIHNNKRSTDHKGEIVKRSWLWVSLSTLYLCGVY